MSARAGAHGSWQLAQPSTVRRAAAAAVQATTASRRTEGCRDVPLAKCRSQQRTNRELDSRVSLVGSSGAAMAVTQPLWPSSSPRRVRVLQWREENRRRAAAHVSGGGRQRAAAGCAPVAARPPASAPAASARCRWLNRCTGGRRGQGPPASAGMRAAAGPAAWRAIGAVMLRRLAHRWAATPLPRQPANAAAPPLLVPLTQPWLLLLGGGKRPMQAPPPHLSRLLRSHSMTGLCSLLARLKANWGCQVHCK